MLQIGLVHLLLLMGDVLPLSCLAQPVALDRARQDDRRRALVQHGGSIGVVDLERIVTADPKVHQLVVGKMTHHLEQARIGAPEVLAQVCAVLDHVALILAVDDFVHALDEGAFGVAREQGVPVGSPEHLDDVPAGAAEDGLEFLDDLAVAADGAVQPLQVAVDDENQVVELFTRGKRDGTERLGFVRLAVTQKRPDLLV